MGQLTQALTAAIKASGQPPGAIADGAGLQRSQLSRFLSGKTGLTTTTVDRLMDYMGLRITIAFKGKTTKGR
jgi:hypothetical protein